MRLTRGTVVLLLISVAAIVAFALLRSTQESDSGATPTPQSANAGPLFPQINPAAIIRFELRDHAGDRMLILERDATGGWAITEATAASELPTDGLAVAGALADALGLAALDRFEPENLTDFGLEEPSMTLALTADDGERFTLTLGDRNPSGNRFYALLDGDARTIYLLSSNAFNPLTRLLDSPPYLPPTATPLPTNTPTAVQTTPTP